MSRRALAAPVVVLLDVLLVVVFALVGLPGYAILSAVLGLLVVIPTLALTDYSSLPGRHRGR
jgi:hypothetical protein